MVKNIYPRHCYDEKFHLKIPFFMWLSFLVGLRHLLFLTPPGRYLFGYSAEIFGHWYFVIPDLLVLGVLAVSGYRVPESGKLARRLWRYGREILLAASLSSIALVLLVEHASLVNPSIWQFEPVAASLLLDGAAVLYLMASPLAKDIFLDFPQPDGKPDEENSQVIASPPAQPRTVTATARPTIHVIGAFCLLLLAYHLIFRDYFPLPNGRMGHDYMGTLGIFLDGFLWYRNNGFITPPWFSPSFCGGQALFADPQSGFYSIPQFLTFLVDPLQAVYWSFLLFAALGFWGMYLFARHCLALERLPAFVAATVFMFNGFYAHRMIIGHYGYQSFMLLPMIALLLLRKPTAPLRSARSIMYSLLAGLLVAYWFHSGLTTLMIPAALGVVCLACLAAFRTPDGIAKSLVARGTLALLPVLGLAASKLNANLTLMSRFARDFYPLPGIAGPADLLEFVLRALFYSSENTYRMATPLWKNIQWSAMPHELAYGVTPIPLAIYIIALGVVALRLRRQTGNSPDWRRHVLPAAILGAILVWPVAMLYYSPEWNAALKSLPLIGSTTSPFRWLIIYIPCIAALSGIAVASAGRARGLVAALAIIGIPLLNFLEVRSYYEAQDHDPRAVLAFYNALRSGTAESRIVRIGAQQAVDNSQLAEGTSPMRCYNPLYGYRLEKLGNGHLVPGPADAVAPDGSLNLLNPACLLFPDENQCRPWDTFKAEQRHEAERFTAYRPFDFVRSDRQVIADRITLTSALLTMIFLVAVTGRFLRKSIKRNRGKHGPQVSGR